MPMCFGGSGAAVLAEQFDVNMVGTQSATRTHSQLRCRIRLMVLIADEGSFDLPIVYESCCGSDTVWSYMHRP